MHKQTSKGKFGVKKEKQNEKREESLGKEVVVH